MIKILTKKYSQSVRYICEKLDFELAKYDVVISRSKQTALSVIREATSGKFSALIIVGNVGESCENFVEALGLAVFYDKFAESNIIKYCT